MYNFIVTKKQTSDMHFVWEKWIVLFFIQANF